MCRRYPVSRAPLFSILRDLLHVTPLGLLSQLLATNLGDQYLPSTLPTKGGTLHWSITRKSSSGATFIKASSTPRDQSRDSRQLCLSVIELT